MLERCIFGSEFGYLGDISLAIMIASVCQHNPNLNVCGIIKQFFKMYYKWNFGYKHQIRLNFLKYENYYINNNNSNIMTVLTPVAPVLNVTQTILQATLKTLSAFLYNTCVHQTTPMIFITCN